MSSQRTDNEYKQLNDCLNQALEDNRRLREELFRYQTQSHTHDVREEQIRCLNGLKEEILKSCPKHFDNRFNG